MFYGSSIWRAGRLIAAAALVMAAAACLALPAGAIAGELPNGEQILDRYVEVTGGIEAYDRVETRIVRSTIEIPSQGMKLSVTVYAARPNRIRSVIESEVFGKIEKGVSGDVVWENSIMTGPAVKEGDERSAALQDAAFLRIIYWRKNFEKAECTGTEQVSGSECHIVVLTPKSGDPVTLSFSSETGLLLKMKTLQQSQAGKVPLESFFSDYRENGGILSPQSARVVVMGQERMVEVQSMEDNAELPEGIFDLPDEIKEIM